MAKDRRPHLLSGAYGVISAAPGTTRSISVRNLRLRALGRQVRTLVGLFHG